VIFLGAKITLLPGYFRPAVLTITEKLKAISAVVFLTKYVNWIQSSLFLLKVAGFPNT